MSPYHLRVPIVYKSWEPQPPGALRTVQVCIVTDLPLPSIEIGTQYNEDNVIILFVYLLCLLQTHSIELAHVR